MYIYVAGPYRLHPQGGEQAAYDMCEVADRLLEMGHIPFVPLLNHWWEERFPEGKDHEYWMHWDLAWLRMCDGILRLPGKSVGADEEVEVAKELGMAVYYGLHEIPDATEGVSE